MPKRRKGIHSASTLIRACANNVMSCIGKGHTERVYHRAMIAALNRQNVKHRSEVLAPIYYVNEVVGFGRCDLVVGNHIIELKANMRPPSHTSPQLQKYMESLKASEWKNCRGMVINFNQKTGRVDFFSPKQQAYKAKTPPKKAVKVKSRHGR